jgi:photoactive yellow protein
MTSTSVDLLTGADVLTQAQLDALPMGIIHLDLTGRVLKYNRAEGELAGVAPADAVGRSFFEEVAPCTRVRQFEGQFREGVAARSLHAVFPYEFRFRDGRRKDVQVSMYYSPATETVWVMVERP